MRPFFLTTLILLFAGPALAATPPLSVSADGRSLEAAGRPFFWLGDTGWLMLSRLDRAETEHYLRTRQQQGYNVIQVMVLHTVGMTTKGGVPALIDGDPARPNNSPGDDPAVAGEYDYWDHLDWTLGVAEELGIYLALVPAWGDIAMAGDLDTENVVPYVTFLAERYRDRPNIVWLNGGDTFAVERTAVWSVLGRTLKRLDPEHLMTFHPRGRTDSSWTFHHAEWLDFNMYQSGHRSYGQDLDGFGEDNWRYAEDDWARLPAKPFIDGEPSYENIPYDLHYADVPRWTAADVRRYAWWSVLSGAFGHTYGENSVMQMYVPGAHNPAFHAEIPWRDALRADGAGQMRHVKSLMDGVAFGTREPAAHLVVDNGTGYERIPVLRGDGFLVAYAYTGRGFSLDVSSVADADPTAHWYSPRDGSFTAVDIGADDGIAAFDPPGDAAAGNDWVLVLRTR